MRTAKRVRNRKKKEESSAQVIASDDDLLSEFLLGLPIESLLKFKCVCKHWLSLISDPHFAGRKYLKSNAVSALYLNRNPDFYDRCYEFVPLHPFQKRAPFEDLTLSDNPHDIQILQSCKGLFCCRLQEAEYFVCNPTTKQFAALPTIPAVPGASVTEEEEVLGLNLAFDPSQSYSYKVVCIQGNYKPSHARRILIYSSETGHWRVCGAPFTSHLSIDFKQGAYWNGAVHWFSIRNASLYFDLNEELLREMPMPPHLAGYDRYFGESGGHLNLVDFMEDELTKHFHVYEMERDRCSWILKFRVNPEGLAQFEMANRRICPISVISVVRGEKEDDSFLVVGTGDGELIRYNFIRQTYHHVFDVESEELCDGPVAFQYIECLFNV